MALQEFQRLLLRLYTDAALQERFYAGNLKSYEKTLSLREKQALHEIPRPLISRFQRSLAAKRMLTLRKRLATMPQRVLYSDFSNQGPILFFLADGKERVTPVSASTTILVKRLAIAATPLSLSAVLAAYRTHEEVTLRAVFALGNLTRRYRLDGRYLVCM